MQRDPIESLLDALLGNPTEMFLQGVETRVDDKVAAKFSETVAELITLDPTKVQGFFVTIMTHEEKADQEPQKPCLGCGEVHPAEPLVKMVLGVGGRGDTVKALVVLGAEKSGIE